MVKMGILDLTKVARAALQNAGAVAGLMATTETMVADQPSSDFSVCAMPYMGGMM